MYGCAARHNWSSKESWRCKPTGFVRRSLKIKVFFRRHRKLDYPCKPVFHFPTSHFPISHFRLPTSHVRRFFRVRRGQVSGHSFRCRPKGEPFWGGNLPFVHGTFLFCFALRKPFALFCRAKKGEKTLEAPQAAPLRLELPVVRHWRLPLMSGIALFQVLCRFPYLSGTTALRLAYRLP